MRNNKFKVGDNVKILKHDQWKGYRGKITRIDSTGAVCVHFREVVRRNCRWGGKPTEYRGLWTSPDNLRFQSRA